MRRITSFLAAAVLLMSGPLYAHGNMDHILGTVAKIAGSVVTVAKDGKSTDVMLTETTTYEVNGAAGKQSDLKVGDRVVIHAVKKDGKEVAHEVRLAHPAKATP
jgi:hypothetical protein